MLDEKKIISISGTHGTGKSTLAYSLCTRLKHIGKNVRVLDEIARKCPFPINQEGTRQSQVWMICEQIVCEMELIKQGYDYIIVDRSIMDPYAYGRVLNVISENFEVEVITDHIAYYYNKIYIPDKDKCDYQFYDGIREIEDQDFRNNVYYQLLEAYDKFGINYKIIEHPTEVYREMDVEWVNV